MSCRVRMRFLVAAGLLLSLGGPSSNARPQATSEDSTPMPTVKDEQYQPVPRVLFECVTTRFGTLYLHFLVKNDTAETFYCDGHPEGGPNYRVAQLSGSSWEEAEQDWSTKGFNRYELLPDAVVGFLVAIPELRNPLRAGVDLGDKAG